MGDLSSCPDFYLKGASKIILSSLRMIDRRCEKASKEKNPIRSSWAMRPLDQIIIGVLLSSIGYVRILLMREEQFV